ncbi:MAG: DUF2029 domain-containing protein [Deltaproteobacteria bacterium]|nr:DUF2029 domain-containing protein [Deltaproteobacteria bacterium]
MKATNRVLDKLSWIFAIFLFCLVAFRPSAEQWDYYNMHESVKAFNLGLDPYQHKNLQMITERPTYSGVGYSYPPLIIICFEWLSLLSAKAGYFIWLVLKLLTYIILFMIWSRYFLPLKNNFLTIFYFIFAFNSTLYIDLATGNVSAFEQLVIWSSFIFLLNARIWPYCICIAIISQIKLIPIVFLLLPLVIHKKPYWLPVIGSAGIFSLIFSVNYFIWPEYFVSFANIVQNLHQYPLAKAHGLLELFGELFGELSGIPKLLYLLLFVIIVPLSYSAIKNFQHRNKTYDIKKVILFFCATYVVAIPRMKDYSYVIILLPALYALMELPQKYLVSVILIPILAPNAINSILPGRNFFLIVYNYMPFLCSCAIWYLFYTNLTHSSHPAPHLRQND